MREYKHHIFYNVDLPLWKKVDIINDAKDLCFSWWVDELDCDKSWSRQRIEMSFEKIMEKFTNEDHFVVIYRRGYEKPHGEIGFRTMREVPDYFLWINIDEKEFFNLIEKHNIQVSDI